MSSSILCKTRNGLFVGIDFESAVMRGCLYGFPISLPGRSELTLNIQEYKYRTDDFYWE